MKIKVSLYSPNTYLSNSVVAYAHLNFQQLTYQNKVCNERLVFLDVSTSILIMFAAMSCSIVISVTDSDFAFFDDCLLYATSPTFSNSNSCLESIIGVTFPL